MMTIKSFDYSHPTRILFGAGRLQEAGRVAASYGKRCMIVSEKVFHGIAPALNRLKDSLGEADVEYMHFDAAVPNPTTESVTMGAAAARTFEPQLIIGFGGGSAIDTAKSIAVEASHPGTAWDYHAFGDKKPGADSLPVLAITTTSGTGANLTQVAVLTNPAERFKSAIVSEHVFPKVTIVDPELMTTVPAHVTASTGFDAFCHAFESYIHRAGSPMTDIFAETAIKSIFQYLPAALKNANDIDARTALAWADTLAGLCIASAGTVLPHAFAMSLGGLFPHVMHGEALAAIYPEYLRKTYLAAPEKFAFLARIMDKSLEGRPDGEAAAAAPELMDGFLAETGMSLHLKDFGAAKEDLNDIAEFSLRFGACFDGPGNVNGDDVRDMIRSSFNR